MGWQILAKPGSKHGPCAAQCDHTDCAMTRADAKRPCLRCGKPIGYEAKFVEVGETKEFSPPTMAHFICELEHVEAEQAKAEGR